MTKTGGKMIIPSYALTATERVLPRLALDWTTGVAQTGVDVTRAGVATFVGSNGLIQLATADTQRIDYSTGTAGLLVEASRTNLLLNSVFDGAVAGTPGTAPTDWTFPLSGGSVDLVTSGVYSGGNAITITTSNNRHFVSQTVSASANTTYCLTLRLTVVSGSVSFNNLFNATGLPSGATTTYVLDGVAVDGADEVAIGEHIAQVCRKRGAASGKQTASPDLHQPLFAHGCSAHDAVSAASAAIARLCRARGRAVARRRWRHRHLPRCLGTAGDQERRLRGGAQRAARRQPAHPGTSQTGTGERAPACCIARPSPVPVPTRPTAFSPTPTSNGWWIRRTSGSPHAPASRGVTWSIPAWPPQK